MNTLGAESLSNADLLAEMNRNIRPPYKKQLAVHLILASIFFESMAFYAITGNIGSTVKAFNWNKTHGSDVSYIFTGTEFFTMFVSAIISDAKVERVKMISIGFSLYLIGFILFTMINQKTTILCPFHNSTNHTITNSIVHEYCAPSIIPILIITAIGAGVVRSNMIAFGADQVQDSKITSRYIDKFIIVINLASILETLAEIYISPKYGYFIFYITAASMLIVAILLFLIGTRYYVHIKPYDTVLVNCFPVCKSAFQTWLKSKKNNNGEIIEESRRRVQRPSTFLDFAKATYHGDQQEWIVDEVKLLRNAFIIVILIFPYKFIFYQLYSTFQYQAVTMKYSTTENNNFILMSEFITVILGIIILNIFIYKYLQTRNRSLTIATKFILSMTFAFLTMCLSGGIELFRQHDCYKNPKSTLSVYIQISQYIGMGLAQWFGLLARFEFACFIAPHSAQSLFMSVHYISRGIASYITKAYITIMANYSIDLYFSCPIKSAHPRHYYIYFFTLAGIQLLFIGMFIFCQKKLRMINLTIQAHR